MLRRLFRKKPPANHLNNTEALIAFLPILESGKLKRAVGYLRKNRQDMTEIELLRDLLRNSPLVGGTGWVHPPASLLDVFIGKDTTPFDSMSASTLRTVLTLLSRHDRLTEGILLSATCQTGIMAMLLQRLKTLHEAGEIA